MAPAHEPAAGPRAFELEVRGIGKRFGAFTALDDVSIRFRGGEVHALVGQNGAGKSTLVKILAGLQPPDGGEVLVDGEPVRIRNPRDARRCGLGFVHQDLALTLEQTIEENLFLGERAPRVPGLGWTGAVSRRAARAAAADVLERVGLGGVDPGRTVASLPVADRWLVAIARGLSREEKMLVLDEPTVSLSDREVSRLFGVIDAIRAEGVAVVFISHRMEEVLHLSDRVTVLRDGRVVAGMPATETDGERLVALMAGDDSIIETPERRGTRGDVLLSVRDVHGEGGVQGVSFELHRGEVLGLAGLVGSRRTETALLVSGMNRVSAGELALDGRAFAPRSPVEGLGAGIVLVAEDRADSVFGELSVAENISISALGEARFHRRLPIVSRRRERAVAERMIKRLGIRTRDHRTPVGTLSGGNQQKVVLARWLHRGAKVFIFDEPTRGIDVYGKQQIYEIVHELAAQGAGVIFISSELPELLHVSDRVVVLREGRSVATLPAGTSEHDVLRWCYGNSTKDRVPTEAS